MLKKPTQSSSVCRPRSFGVGAIDEKWNVPPPCPSTVEPRIIIIIRLELENSRTSLTHTYPPNTNKPQGENPKQSNPKIWVLFFFFFWWHTIVCAMTSTCQKNTFSPDNRNMTNCEIREREEWGEQLPDFRFLKQSSWDNAAFRRNREQACGLGDPDPVKGLFVSKITEGGNSKHNRKAKKICFPSWLVYTLSLPSSTYCSIFCTYKNWVRVQPKERKVCVGKI